MNTLAIIVAALLAFIIGFLFHGPLFGKVWMKLANVHPTGNEKCADMMSQMCANFFSNLVMATVLSGVIWIAFTSPVMGEITWYKGVISAAWVWLGFVVTSSSMEVIWMGRSVKLWLFECVSWLVMLAAMGALIAVWR